MNPQTKYGLIIGLIGLIINTFVAAALGICGPVIALIGGAIAGFLAANEKKAAQKSENAKAGAIAGLTAGGLIFIGQVIGGVLALVLFRSTMADIFGVSPSTTEESSFQLGYYLGGFGIGMCLGAVDLVAAALAGAGTGYLIGGTKPQTADSA
jgi:prolipoprotein diacylglyceryltransferase